MANYARATKKWFLNNYFSNVWEKAFTISFTGTITLMLTGCFLSAMFGI